MGVAVSNLIKNAAVGQVLPAQMSFVVDSSGSMEPYVKRVVDAVEGFIDHQGEVKGQFSLSISKFDDKYERLYDGPLQEQGKKIKDLFRNNYNAYGGTALRDALMQSITDAEKDAASAGTKPKKTIITLITDGADNRSRTTAEKVREAVGKKIKEGWVFLLFGVEDNTLGMAADLGIPQNNALQYRIDNLDKCVELLSNKVTGLRRGKPLQITAGERAQLLALPDGKNKNEL